MQNIQEVSLGFAEFVSQLIQETFDAIMSSQNYQLERYAELQNRLNLPNEAYKIAFDIDNKVKERFQQNFGLILASGTRVNEALKDFLEDNFDETSQFINNKGILTVKGYVAVKELLTELVITEEKSLLNTLINQSDVSKLVVDSGEITAKLELSSMFMSQKEEKKDNSSKGKVTKKPPTKSSKFTDPKVVQGDATYVGNIDKISLPSFNQVIDIIKFQNDQTGRKTILIDRQQFDKVKSSNVLIPNVRLSAQPTKLTSNSNLYSEIKISFKTV